MRVTAALRADAVAVGVVSSATMSAAEVLQQVASSAETGLAREEVVRRQAQWGPNAVSSHRARLVPVLWHQLRSPLLALLLVAAVASYFVGERSDAVIIGVIVALSVGLGFVNEYRAEKAAEALHDQIHHETVVIRDGQADHASTSPTLVPGDLVELRLGDIVPADIRLLDVTGLEMRRVGADRRIAAGRQDHRRRSPPGPPLAELTGCALMGTVVHAGSGRGVVVATGARTEFGKIAAGLSTHQLDTEFQVGLRKFSMLLVYVAGALTTSIFVINVVLHKPIMDALLFSLAIAVGITPQLLPAVVSTSLAAGSRRMSRRKVLVKRLVCIEDLGNVDVLFTDKTGTLTAGPHRLHARRARRRRGDPDDGAAVGAAVHRERGRRRARGRRESARSGAVGLTRGDRTSAPRWPATPALGVLPFDHERNMVSVLVRDPDATAVSLVTKGAPETVLDRCVDVPRAARERAGRRVRCRQPGRRRRDPRRATDAQRLTAGDERGPAPGRPAGVPRPAQARRRRSAAPAGRSRHRGQGRHRATTRRSPSRSATTSGSATVTR